MPDELEGYQIDLDDKRHVFVARHEDTFWIQFKNAAGDVTRMKLSIEAGEALRYLLQDAVPKPEDTIKKFMLHMSMAGPKAEPQFEWQAVKADTAVAL